MSSRSPRTRIDQFFTSKKKKPISPCLKAEKCDKDAKSTFDGSPSAKGTLDSFLVNSQNDGCLVKPSCKDSGSVSNNDPVKRNLTLEINLASEFIKKPTSSLNNLESREHSEEAGGTRDFHHVAPFKISNELITSHDACDNSTQAHGKEMVSSTSGEQNLELKQFASDFLSLYCSELPSSVHSPLESKLHGNKRDGSPSLLVDNCKMCKKKRCISPCNQSQLEEENTSLERESSEKVKSGSESRPSEASSGHSGTPKGDRKAGKEPDVINSEAYSSFRKSSQVPNSFLIMGESCITPGPLINPLPTRGTPKSLRRSSLISPGDAFWNEAIQVADGLFVPYDKVSAHVAKAISHIEGQGKMDAENSSKSVEDDAYFRHLELNATVGSTENYTEENARSPAVDLHNDVSPLPVRHFDFSFEEKNLDGSGQHQHTSINKKDLVRNGFHECNSVNQSVLRTSNILTRCKSLTNEPHNSEVTLEQSFLKPLKVDENASDLAARDGESSKSSQENNTEIVDVHKESVLGRTSGVCCRFDEADTPSSSRLLSDGVQLSNWLPTEICDLYMKRGISKLYSWQVACLQVDGVLQKRNLVYCASTSAGKSFVAEILMLRQVMSTGKMSLLVLPYVSICAEKAEHLEGLLQPLGKHVRSFYGNQGGGTLPKDTSVAVCTIEKANSLVNRLLEEGRLSEVGIIVIDELHMVGDQNRGYLLELLLTKLRYAAGEGNAESSSGDSSSSSSGKSDPAHGLQIIGMSATMPNVAAVADWLKAALYETDFRPVPLEEYFKVGNTVFNKKMDIVRTIPKSADLGGKDPDHIVELCNEVVQEGHSVLIFCSSRKGCESTATHVAKFLKGFSTSNRNVTREFSDASSAIDALRRCPAGLDPILEATLPSGVAYHHAGLTVEEREIVETCYRSGLVHVLTATSTLAAGVNLPARRVIFRQPRIGLDFIDGTRYRQMAGRAGRTGIDTRGESVLICKPEEVKRITAMLNNSCPPLQSCLSEDKNGMTHAILEVVAGGIVQTASDIHRYVRCTLLNSTKPFEDVVKSAQDSLRWLCHRKFLEWNEDTKLYSTTPLGRAAFGSSLCPEESLVVLDDLSRAREGFVLSSDLHLVYLVTPINVDVEPDWELYYERFMELSALDQVEGEEVYLEHSRTMDQVADFLTKIVSKRQFSCV